MFTHEHQIAWQCKINGKYPILSMILMIVTNLQCFLPCVNSTLGSFTQWQKTCSKPAGSKKQKKKNFAFKNPILAQFCHSVNTNL
jgi:hypothetical protein